MALDTQPTRTGYTLSEIAELVCQADRLPLAARPSILQKIRRLVVGGHLQDGDQAGGRGTWAFPQREVFRAAIFIHFGRLGVIDAAPAQRALELAAFSLGRRRSDSATAGLDALLESARASDGPTVLEVRVIHYEHNVSAHARVGAPTPWTEDEHSRLVLNLGRLVRAIDSVLAAGH